MTYPLTTWRLIYSTPGRGAWNMAVDEALLEAVGRNEVLPTLRLYAWEPACLSLGYAQPSGEADQERLQSRGWDLVRRPTGGRAILHIDELTYSIVGPQDEPRLAGSVLESYRNLSAALLHALQLLSIPAQALPKAEDAKRAKPETKPGMTSSQQNPICFEAPSNYEITVQGKKLIGSAQARRKEGVLQHGSLPLYGDLTRITQALIYPSEADRQIAALRLQQRATTVAAALDYTPTWSAAAKAFVGAFKDTLNLQFITAELTEAESLRAQQLIQEKYTNPSWTYRT
jgi:lipoate-protein ligase A